MQSRISKHISQMEKELGHQLFDRTTRKVSLTDVGTAFLEKCQQISAIYSDALVAINNIAATSTNSLHIVFSDNMRQYGVLNLTYAFSDQYPEVDIRITEFPTASINALLHSKAYNFAFSSSREMFDNDVVHHLFAVDELVLVIPKDHRLAREGAVSIEEIQDETIVLCTAYSVSDRFFAECSDRGVSVMVKMKTSNAFTALNAAKNKQGIALIGKQYYLQHEAQFKPYVVMAELKPHMPFNIYLQYLDSRPLTKAMRAYLKYLTAEGEKTQQQT